ncbi:hypothetical protein [Candidatus Palauibacter irciniicola]|uniref:hypothetical protein n=1 Tax=Candidatus Palauibacter irciniicola TaxID=3056733 RepID=UPI003B026FEF
MNRRPSRSAVSPKARIAALARDDKWFLGGLDGVVWAPPFPRWLHRPGFWDPVHLLQHEVGPGFSVALVGSDGRERPLRRAAPGPGGGEPAVGRWRPGRLVVAWLDERDVLVEERRQVLPGGVLESAWHVPRDFEGHLVGFTAQPADATDGVEGTADGVGWTRTVSDRRGQELVLRMELSGSGSPAWRRVVPSEGRGAPEWRHSPFAEEAGGGAEDAATGAFSGPDAEPDAPRSGWTWIAVALPLAEVDEDSPPTIRLALRVRDADDGRARATSSAPPAAGTTGGSAWESFFGGFPHFESGDPYLDRTFDYRIHGLGLNRIEGRGAPYGTPPSRRARSTSTCRSPTARSAT